MPRLAARFPAISVRTYVIIFSLFQMSIDTIGIRMEKKTILRVPRVVRIEGKFLLHDTGAPDEKDASPLVLHQFLRLDADDPLQIADFAGTWGVLGICNQHGMPVGHPLRHGMIAKHCWPKKVKRDGEYWFAEPVSAWKRISGKAASLIRISRMIERLKPGEPADWRVIEGHLDESDPPWGNLRTARSRFEPAIQDWLEIGGIRPRFEWDHERRNWMLRHDIPGGPWNLFGWLALRLAVEISGGRFALCSNCGREHHVARMPSAGKPSYCGSKECRRALWRNNKRENASG
jgi:hypothetical protein